MKKVIHYKLGFNTVGNFGVIRIFLDDNSYHDFLNLSPEKFTAIFNMLSKEPLFWNGTYLTTDIERVIE